MDSENEEASTNPTQENEEGSAINTEDYLQYLDSIGNDEEEEGDEYVFSYFDLLDRPRTLLEPINLNSKHLKQIAAELGLIKLCWPKLDDVEFEDRIFFPESYLKNNEKEKLLLLYTENFRKQFYHLNPNRKPLFLASDNECGMQKMVSTTINPTTLPYPEINNWKECAKFVGDHLNYEPLYEPTLIPARLYSPNTTFQRQTGNSFELATALCSLLIGFGYDAYVVSGYGVQDATTNVLIRIDCPFLPEVEVEEKEKKENVDSRYALKKPRDLRSKFKLMLEQREKDRIKDEEEIIAQEERARILEIEKPPHDELEGQRVHAWILLRAGKRDVDESMFIEASTGIAYPLNTTFYCGIESVWNHQNYWVNMQDCADGVGNMEYDFTDLTKWEHLLIGEPIDTRRHISVTMEDEETIKKNEALVEKHLDMPTSWSLPISISHEALKRRFPNGMKITYYKRTKAEEYAPYIQPDGLVKRISRYKDFECVHLESSEEIYENRMDKLYKNVNDVENNFITDYFLSGREDGVIKHVYSLDNDSVYDNRTLEYKYRVDGLSKIIVDPTFLTEYYSNREDCMYYRHTEFAANDAGSAGGKKQVIKMTVKYTRNEKKSYKEDIETKVFYIHEGQIQIKYHYGPGCITASTRTFMKPPLAELGEDMKYHPELTFGYEADICAKPTSKLQQFKLLMRLLQEEKNMSNNTREVTNDIDQFLMLRNHQRAFSQLTVSLFNREQNMEARMGMIQRENQNKLKKEKEIEEDIDYIAPYLARLGDPHDLSSAQVRQIKDECLKEFKQLLIDRAMDVQKNFERTTERLQQRQAWFNLNYDSINSEEEAAYLNEVTETMFLLHCLEIRLSRHRDLSPYRFESLLHYLQNHEKLCKYPINIYS